MAAKKILIAEDEKPIAKALSLKLNSLGFETTIVEDGDAALAVCQSAQFDLIVLDLIMPKKDGFAVLNELKSLKITTPVVVSSNLNQEEDIKRAKELGSVGYFVKSDISLSEIAERIKKATS